MAAPQNYTVQPLLNETLVPAAAAQAYLAPSGANDRGIICAFIPFTNQTGTETWLTVWKVKAGEVRGDRPPILIAAIIPGSGFPEYPLKPVFLAPGDAIDWQAGAANTISGAIDGVVIEV